MNSYPSITGGIAAPPVVPSGRNLSVAGIAGRSRKGWPFRRLTIDKDNLIKTIGKGIAGQPEVYQLYAHVNSYEGNVAEFVRVVDILTAKFPSLELKLNVALTGTMSVTAGSKAVVGVGTAFETELSEGGIITIEGEVHEVDTITDNLNFALKDNHVAGAAGASATKNEWVTRSDTYDTDIALSTSGMCVSLGDGSHEETYGMSLTGKTNLELADGVQVPVFTMAFHEKIAGSWEAITGESYTVSLDPSAKNDRGESLYWPAVLNAYKSNFKGISLSGFTNHDLIPEISTPMQFVGAVEGNAPDTADFQAGWDLFDGDDTAAMMGIIPNNDVDAAVYAIKIFYDKNALTCYSAPGTLTVDAAKTHRETILTGVGSKRRFLALNYGPMSVQSDPFFGLPMDLDWDGAMTGACAFGDSGTPEAGEDVGIHSQPAGETRGLVSVYGVAEPKYTLTHADKQKLGEVDINFLTISNATGACKISQARTQVGHNIRPKDRQIGVQRTQAYMLTWFKDYLEAVQHESDGVTEKQCARGAEILRDLLLGTNSIYTPKEGKAKEGYPEALTYTFTHNEDTGENDIGLAGYITGSSEFFNVTVMSV